MALYERSELLERLSSLQRDAYRGPGRLVLVSGEAGIGKTSLVEAFCSARGTRARVLWGSCDAITPPRAFAPLGDIGATVGGPLHRALEAADRDGVLQSFLALLQGQDRPTTVVLEDMHWADNATLDLLRVLGRRLHALAVLVIATYRDDEVDAQHPLRLALGDVPTRMVTELSVPPLTREAIGALPGASGLDTEALYAATAGNPFFATEVIAAGAGQLPPHVRDAVLARAARLSPPARAALRAASILGPRWSPALLKEVAPCDDLAIEECRARGMLRDFDGNLGFRHDLAQQALRTALRPAERVELNQRALAVLRARSSEVDLARLARHAVEADDADAIQELAPAAGDRAAALGAHREAAAHFAAALRLAEHMDGRARARLLEAYARECRIIDLVDTAVASQEEAIGLWHELGDGRREGDGLQALSMMLWLAGEPRRALDSAERAVTLLEPLTPHGPELARAYAALAQRLTNAGDDRRAMAMASRAHALAESIGEERVAVHAMTTLGLSETYLGLDAGWARLEQAARRAMSAGLEEEAARALINLVEAGRDLRRFDLADRFRDEAVAYVEDHDVDLYRRRLNADLAELALERGRWDEAADRANAVLAESRTAPLIRAKALTVIGRLRARRGDGDPWAALDEALQLVGPAADVQDLFPTCAARTEASWLDGDGMRAASEARRALDVASRHPDDAWWLGEAGLWAWKTGLIGELPPGSAKPYVLHATGRHRDAGVAWHAVGCPYHRAQALADSSDEADLRQALALLNALDALPLARTVRERLRATGARSIARGPRQSTRRNPARLTERQAEVLEHLQEGLSNAEIARRLVVSPKTVDHHVSAILHKLGVTDRAAAARAAEQLASKDGEPPATT